MKSIESLNLISGCVCGGPWTTLLEEKLYGYRWNHIFRCIIETPVDSGGYGADFCRVPVDCKVCRDVDKIDEYHVSELTVDMFQQRYAYSDRPVVIRNATLDWPAMEKLNFAWLKEAYLRFSFQIHDQLTSPSPRKFLHTTTPSRD